MRDGFGALLLPERFGRSSDLACETAPGLFRASLTETIMEEPNHSGVLRMMLSGTEPTWEEKQ